jgi:hypothetical protein
MEVSVSQNKNDPEVIRSILGRFIKKLTRIFDWVAEGQTAGALCKG